MFREHKADYSNTAEEVKAISCLFNSFFLFQLILPKEVEFSG